MPLLAYIFTYVGVCSIVIRLKPRVTNLFTDTRFIDLNVKKYQEKAYEQL